MPASTTPQNIADPHCTGFYGEQYDFMGDDGKYYNMISTGTLQINSRMKSMEQSDFTYIDATGVKIGNEKVGLTKIMMTLDVNSHGEPIAYLDQYIITKDPIHFSTGLKHKNGDEIMGSVYLEKDTLYVNSGNCVAKIKRVTEDEELGEIPHLDMALEVSGIGVLSDGVMPHGVLGQTADLNRVKPQGLLGKGIHEKIYRHHKADHDVFLKQGFGVVEGNYKDYEVTGPFEDDFKFNKFGTPPTTQPVYGKCSHLVSFL